MNIEFDPLARLELNDAIDYYNFKLKGLGNRFKEEVFEGIIRIKNYPGRMGEQQSQIVTSPLMHGSIRHYEPEDLYSPHFLIKSYMQFIMIKLLS